MTDPLELLKRIPLFADLPEADLRTICESSEEKTLAEHSCGLSMFAALTDTRLLASEYLYLPTLRKDGAGTSRPNSSNSSSNSSPRGPLYLMLATP